MAFFWFNLLSITLNIVNLNFIKMDQNAFNLQQNL